MPRIGIPVPTSGDLAYNEKSWPEYAQAVQRAGGEPVRLPLGSGTELAAAARDCSGFVLPGSPADVDPALYGELRGEATATADPAREACDRWLLENVGRSGYPVLAICFGAQFLNVWAGGSLVQDLGPLPVNHSAGGAVAVAHSVLLPGATLLSALVPGTEAPSGPGKFRRLLVNSSHHQAISTVGEGLQVVARCGEDAVVEAVEGRVGAAQVLGGQWHPERSTAISPASRALFLWLVSAAADAADGLAGGSLADAF